MYSDFARGYYNVMKDTYQDDFLNYYKKVAEKFNIPSDLVLDLGCGSGDITKRMAKSGFDMIGIDASFEMLSIANDFNKCDNIMYICQDMRDFELYGTVGMIYSAMDCINYITDKDDLKKVFKLCMNYLDYDGILIFDINTVYKFVNILNDKTYVYDTDKEYLVWQSEYEEENKLCNFYIDMFYYNNGAYDRLYEEQQERAYEIEEIKEMLLSCGFKIEGIFDNLSFDDYKENSERVFFVCRKRKENE